MLAQHYLDRRRRRFSADQITLPIALSDLQRLARLRLIVVVSPELLWTGYTLRQTYPTAGWSTVLRAEVVGRAAGVAGLQDDPLFEPFLNEDPLDAPDFSLVRAQEYTGTIGRAAQAIIQQIIDAAGQAILLLKQTELVAVFDLYRTLLPEVDAIRLELEGMGVQLLLLSNTEEQTDPFQTVSKISDHPQLMYSKLELEKRIILSLPGEVEVHLDRLADLPVALRKARLLLGPLVWYPT